MATSVHTPEDLGAAVREARLARHLSQAELARDANVGRQWLVGLEAGEKASAPFSLIMRVLTALNLPLELDPTPPFPPPAHPIPIISAEEILARHTHPKR